MPDYICFSHLIISLFFRASSLVFHFCSLLSYSCIILPPILNGKQSSGRDNTVVVPYRIKCSGGPPWPPDLLYPCGRGNSYLGKTFLLFGHLVFVFGFDFYNSLTPEKSQEITPQFFPHLSLIENCPYKRIPAIINSNPMSPSMFKTVKSTSCMWILYTVSNAIPKKYTKWENKLRSFAVCVLNNFITCGIHPIFSITPPIIPIKINIIYLYINRFPLFPLDYMKGNRPVFSGYPQQPMLALNSPG